MADPSTPTFDLHAQQYDQDLQQGLDLTGESKDYYAQRRVAWTAELLKRAGEQPARVLDYGCGTGAAIPPLLQAFPSAEFTGTDISPASLAIAGAQNPAATFLPLGQYEAVAPFDLCYCNGVFHHIPPAQRAEAAAGIYRSLRPGGRFAFWENNPLNPGTRMVMSRIPFDREAITLKPWESVRLLRDAGFEVERVDYLFFFPRILAALRPLERLLYRVPLGGQYLVLARRTT